MSTGRDQVRALVRRELLRALEGASPVATPGSDNAALAEIYQGPECRDDADLAEQPACVIEPERPCIQTGYCKKLGY